MSARLYRLLIESDYMSMSIRAADILTRSLRENPKMVMCLAAGRTQLATYDLLVDRCRAGEISFSQATVFAMDEYLGLAKSDPRSLHRLLWHAIISRVDIAPENFHYLNSLAPDPKAEAERYEDLINQAGGIDFALLGIGVNGHIGFNEPGSPFDSRTRVVSLTPETLRQNASMLGNASVIATKAITMGIGTLLESRKIVLLASGRDKSLSVARALSGKPSVLVPASALQLHADCTFILDREAASLLERSIQSDRLLLQADRQ